MDARELHYDNLSQVELGRVFPPCHPSVLLSHCPLLPMIGAGESSGLEMQTGNCEGKKGEAKVRWAMKAQVCQETLQEGPGSGDRVWKGRAPQSRNNFLLQGERSVSMTPVGSS